MLEDCLASVAKAFSLGRFINKAAIIRPNRLWLVTTALGEFAIKQLHNYCNENALQGICIAKAFAKTGINVVMPRTCLTGEFIYIHYGKQFMVFPWQTGSVLSSVAAPAKTAYQVGELLAQIHNANLLLPNISISAWHNFQLPDWKALIENIPAVQNDLATIEKWTELYLNAKQHITEETVISHGDLTQANIIWDNKNIPIIIDWDSAGWLYPQVELLGVALNWSGINQGKIEQDSFVAVLKGYQSSLGKITIDSYVIQVSMGSWLAWLAFNLQQYLLQPCENISREILTSLRVLNFLSKSIKELLELINSVN